MGGNQGHPHARGLIEHDVKSRIECVTLTALGLATCFAIRLPAFVGVVDRCRNGRADVRGDDVIETFPIALQHREILTPKRIFDQRAFGVVDCPEARVIFIAPGFSVVPVIQ
ncbi:hypothetical protein DIE17_13610 [Burkholderia sp. Bp9099]|nr:hypothetical protein DIE17_13610 [Burkholderia sp. Bp9099]